MPGCWSWLGDGADLKVADLCGPLPYSDDTFDDVVASLVLHYVENWGPALAELRRILRPGGRLIASADHTFAINLIDAFTRAGFRITVISEPEPDPAARELFLEVVAAKPRFLCFLFFVLQADSVSCRSGESLMGLWDIGVI